MTDGVGNLNWAACTDFETLDTWDGSRRSDEEENEDEDVLIEGRKGRAEMVEKSWYTKPDDGRLEVNDAADDENGTSRRLIKQSG